MRRLILIRHAEAVGPKKSGYVDRTRRLTRKGQAAFSGVLDGFLRVPEAQPGLLLTSPFVRAWQTAELLGERWGIVPGICEALAPEGSPHAVMRALRPALKKRDQVYLVGHSPGLDDFIAHFLGNGAPEEPIRLKKGGMACIEFKRLAPGSGKLVWVMTPKRLAALSPA